MAKAAAGVIGRRVPRALHPVAWWLWALGLAVTVTRTSNPLLLALVVCVLGVVVVSRRGDAPWARAWRYYLLLAFVVIAIRIGFRIVFGGDVTTIGEHTLVRLPEIPLPRWAAGVQIGGPVTAEELLSALYNGLVLAALLCCIGAANVLANPKRALRILPRAVYELGVAAVVAVSIAPQLVESVQRARRAQRLRGNDATGVRALRVCAVPVLEDALDRSLLLAAAMDARGYGRRADSPPRAARITAACMLCGAAGLSLGAYGLLGTSGPGWVEVLAFGVGASGCVAGLAIGGRRIRRSNYRPDPWRLPEWAVAACGLLPAIVLTVGSSGALNPSTEPIVWPTLPLLPMIAILVAAAPAVLAPPPTRPAVQPRVPASAGQDAAGAPVRVPA